VGSDVRTACTSMRLGLTSSTLCQVPGLVEAGFSRFDGVPSEVLSCVQSFVLDGRDQSELAV
jgi:hypothetical protein